MASIMDIKKRLCVVLGYPEYALLEGRRCRVMFKMGDTSIVHKWFKGTLMKVSHDTLTIDFDDGEREVYTWKEVEDMMDTGEISGVMG